LPYLPWAETPSRSQIALKKEGMPAIKPATTTTRPKNAVANYISETIAELKKVTWLSRRDLLYLSGLVLLATVVVGAVLYIFDWGFSKLIELLINTVKG